MKKRIFQILLLIVVLAAIIGGKQYYDYKVNHNFKVISEGSSNNPSMVAWKNTLKPKDIQKISSYVLSLQGCKPVGGKEAEGEKWVEDVAPKVNAAVTAKDSAKIAEVPPK